MYVVTVEFMVAAEHLEGESFQGRLVGASGVVWEGRFDLGSELRLEQFARDRLANSEAGTRVAGGVVLVKDDRGLRFAKLHGLPVMDEETGEPQLVDEDGLAITREEV